MAKKILIVGMGFFGEKLFRALGDSGYDVEAATKGAANGSLELDISDRKSVENVFSESIPDVVVHTAALSNVDYCEEHKDEAFKINVTGTRNIAEACGSAKAKLVFLSTDYVFDGKKGNYSEKDKTNPIQYYGATKLIGEEDVLKVPGSLVLRTSSLFGFNSARDRLCFPRFVISQLKQGKEVNASMQKTSPTLIDDLAVALKQLVEMNASGLYHAVGATGISRFDVAKAAAEMFGLDESLVKKAKDLHFAAKRPENSTLNIEKLVSAGIEMHSFSQALEIMKKQMEESE